MAADLIQDRGRGPEIAGTRITVYNLLTSFLDPEVTEEEIGRVNAAATRSQSTLLVRRAAGEDSQSKRRERRSGVVDPCRLVRQVKQFAG